jgi:NitT/TauT family transport system substrate-binding protein
MKRLMTCLLSLFGLSVTAVAKDPVPSFTLAWSEYPSWSIIDVASNVGLINGAEGKLGSIEKQYNVDIVLKLLDYDPCIQSYASNQVDAVCITNIDILSPSLGRKSVAILPTSTSYGGDALIVPSNISSLTDLKGKQVYGLGKSVSEYAFVGILEANNIPAEDVTFTSMDPAQVALALQGNDNKVQAGVIWNPFVLDTLKKRKDLKVLADSRSTPFEIIDMVVVGEDSLRRPGGENFAKAICAAYFAINERLNSNDSDIRDQTLIAIGEKFSNLGINDMRKVIQQTRFFGTPQQALAVLNNERLLAEGNTLTIGNIATTTIQNTSDRGTNLKKIMETVVSRSKKIGILEKDIIISYGSSIESQNANLRFDSQYIQSVSSVSGK